MSLLVHSTCVRQQIVVLGLEFCTSPTNVETALQRPLFAPLHPIVCPRTYLRVILRARRTPLLLECRAATMLSLIVPNVVCVLLFVTLVRNLSVLGLTRVRQVFTFSRLQIVWWTSLLTLLPESGPSLKTIEWDSSVLPILKHGPLAAVLTRTRALLLIKGSRQLRRSPPN